MNDLPVNPNSYANRLTKIIVITFSNKCVMLICVNGNVSKRQISPEKNFIPENEKIANESGMRKKMNTLSKIIKNEIRKIDFIFIFLLGILVCCDVLICGFLVFFLIF